MARFEIDFLTEYSDEAFLGELRRIAALLPEGEPLAKAAFERLSPKVAAKTIQCRFRGWQVALDQAELGHLYGGQPSGRHLDDPAPRPGGSPDRGIFLVTNPSRAPELTANQRHGRFSLMWITSGCAVARGAEGISPSAIASVRRRLHAVRNVRSLN